MKKKNIIIGLFCIFAFRNQYDIKCIDQTVDIQLPADRAERCAVIQSLNPEIKKTLTSRKWKRNKHHNIFDEIIPHLYLGDYSAFRSIDNSRKNPYTINKVVKITDIPHHNRKFSQWYVDPCKDVEILDIGIDLYDMPKNKYLLLERASGINKSYKTLNIEQWFEETFKFIDEGLIKGTNVLVHCTLGRSRSSTIVIAYLISRFDVSYEIALEYVKACRPCVLPNRGFQMLLSEYREKLSRLH